MTKSTAKPYYASQEVHDTFTKLGNGNRSKGAQVAASYHGRLIEALEVLTHHEVSADDEAEARALLAEIEEARK